MIRKLLLIVSVAVSHVQGDAAVTQIQKMVARPPVMCGAFEQQKTLVGLKKPVKSAGRFCAVADKGVLWNTLTPFASTLRLSREEIVQSQGDRVTSRLSAREEPTVGVISDLLFSVLAGDFARLKSGFRIDATAQPASWNATLVPKESGMRRVISAIELSGAEYVQKITMLEASGDRTVITFSNMATGQNALQPDEAKAFAAPAGRGSTDRGTAERSAADRSSAGRGEFER
ncbi:MAG: outer membrane lipoprotein carrier protein LolA [Gemmatimonas sp.]